MPVPKSKYTLVKGRQETGEAILPVSHQELSSCTLHKADTVKKAQ